MPSISRCSLPLILAQFNRRLEHTFGRQLSHKADTLARMRSAVALLSVAVGLLGIACLGGSQQTALYQTVEITVSNADGGSANIRAEVVHRPRQRQQGLMLRTELDDSAGMLFLFPDDRTGGFWMKDTYLPLDIAYIDSNWTVVDVLQGTPLDRTLVVPAKAYRFVLEMNQGWFAEHGFGVGASVAAPVDQLPAPE